ncbi:Putative hypothetical protein [Helicobacter mustelae 12198]|uniref:Uncharacterized protein n=1 Tax=Helicobacter mustelae (strain ATCC 43772 / CCUG 25715 / CIP 103759 / LMG 18044 / NCTC 12198 / R85-136P) TaxID=679897 RepID=D3UHC7_HELM1|nr:Putative hypothetical protein [Helicobacter mustelae 12198]
MQIKLGQIDFNSSVPLLFYVQVKSDEPIIFDVANLQFFQNVQTFHVLTSKEVIASNYDFQALLQNFNISMPPMNNPQYFPNPYPIFFTYSPFMAPLGGFYGGGFNMNGNYYREAEYSRRILAAHYFRKSTLHKTGFTSGFVAVALRKLTNESPLQLRVQVGSDTHTFKFEVGIPPKK